MALLLAKSHRAAVTTGVTLRRFPAAPLRGHPHGTRLCYTRSLFMGPRCTRRRHMRMAIFGAGAVGAYVGGRLAQAGVPVAFVARGDHLHALARDGLRVESPQGDFVVRPWLVTDDSTMVGIVDVVIVGLKTWQLPEVLRALPALVGPDTCVGPLQNGVEATPQLDHAVGGQAVVGGCCRIMSVRVAPGHIQHRGGIDPSLLLGGVDQRRSAW